MLARLFEFGEFHPIDRDGLVQDIDVLILSSQAQAIYADASEMLPSDYSPGSVPSSEKPETFNARCPSALIQELSEQLIGLHSESLPKSGKQTKTKEYEIEAIREAALETFEGLNRVRFSYEDKRTALLEGYVPTSQIEMFRDVTGEYYLLDEPVGKKEAETEKVPSMFSELRGVSLFENITLMKGFPKYDEIDPTPITALVFPLFFGIMFSDLGHGLVLFFFGYLLWKMFRGSYNYWGKLLMVLGSASIVTGFIRGSFFGLEFGTPLRILTRFPEALSGGFNIAAVPFWLEISIILGTFHLSSAYALYFLNRLKSKQFGEAAFSGAATIVLYGSAVPLMLALIGSGLQLPNVLSDANPTPFFQELLNIDIPISAVARISLPVFLGAMISIILGRTYLNYRSETGRWRIAESAGLGLLEGIVKPFEFFTNTISYLRLGILAILGTILTTLAAETLGFGFIGFAVAAFANLGIIAIEAFMVYVQDLRLHVYEWLSNFYSGSGIPFEPLMSKGLVFSVKWR